MAKKNISLGDGILYLDKRELAIGASFEDVAADFQDVIINKSVFEDSVHSGRGCISFREMVVFDIEASVRAYFNEMKVSMIWIEINPNRYVGFSKKKGFAAYQENLTHAAELFCKEVQKELSDVQGKVSGERFSFVKNGHRFFGFYDRDYTLYAAELE